VNPKWHFKINLFNAKTVAVNLHGLQKSKNFTNKKVLIHHCVVKTVGQKLVQPTMADKEAEAGKEDQDNLFQ
jgi:hypothetical protein